MNLNVLKQKIGGRHESIGRISNEYVRAKDDSVMRQKLSLILKEISAQIVWLSEQNAELMRKLEK